MQETHGWAGRRLKVYLTEGKVVKEPLSEELRLNYLGGRGLNSKTLYDDLTVGADPLGPDNVLMVAAGPLCGTAAPSTARWTVTAKSTMTGGLGDGNGGGDFAAELKFAGYDQVVFYGRSPKPVYLFVDGDAAEIRDASHLWGKTTKETYYQLIGELQDPETRILSIGPAGENLVRVSKVFSNITRTGGKGGMGAVMGSKNLKAVAVRGRRSVRIADPPHFRAVVDRLRKKISASLFLKSFGEQGTLHLIRTQGLLKNLPTRNHEDTDFEEWENLSWESFSANYLVKNRACFSCPVGCGHYYRVKDGPYQTHGESNEYGTTYPFGPKCAIGNLAALLKINSICDMLGLDTHSTGNTIAFAMDCWQRGLLTAQDTEGLDLSWGNADSVIELLPRIAYKQGFGALLADGSQIASRKIKGSEVCLRTTKSMEVSALALGPSQNVTQAIGYATATRGADHLRGGVGFYSYGSKQLLSAMGSEAAMERLLKEPRSPEGKGIFLAIDQDFASMTDSLEFCCFVTGGRRSGLFAEDMAELFSTATGVDMSSDDLMRVGGRVSNLEKAFNVLHAGHSRKDDTLPDIFLHERVKPYGIVGIDKAKFQGMLDEFYRFRGWDSEGIPTRAKLVELGLDDVAERLATKQRAPV